MKVNFKIFIVLILFLIIFVLSLLLYQKKQIELNKIEAENILIDEYNFKQLENIKIVLDKLDKNSYKFKNLNEFNKKFNQNIKPIKNCYILSNSENFYLYKNIEYIFMFKMYSKKYKKLYNNFYYVYPESKYKIIEESLCSKGGGVCVSDIAFGEYEEIISNPCKD